MNNNSLERVFVEKYILFLLLVIPFYNPDCYADSKNTAATEIINLVKSGNSYNCTSIRKLSDSSIGNGEINNQLYISQGKISIESIMKLSSKNLAVMNYTIADGTYMYAWGSAGESIHPGIKKRLDSPDVKYSLQNSINSLDGPFNCISWTADQSKFTPPSSIQFSMRENRTRNVAILKSMSFEKPSFVIAGRYLTKVEIRSSKSKSGLGGISNNLLGLATLKKTSDNEIQSWIFPAPIKKPSDALSILAIGYENEKVVSTVKLPDTMFDNIWK